MTTTRFFAERSRIRNENLDAVGRVVDDPRRGPAVGDFGHERPGFERLPDEHLAPLEPEASKHREAPLEEWLQPTRIKLEADRRQVRANRSQVLQKEGRKHVCIVERGVPANERLGAWPGRKHREDRANEQRRERLLLDLGHGRKSAKLDQTLEARRRVEVPELVDADLRPVGVAAAVGHQIAKEAVEETTVRRPVERVDAHAGRFELVQLADQGLVGARGLRPRTDILTGEKIRKRRVPLPIADDARDEVRTLKEGVLVEAWAPEQHVGAASCPLNLAVEMMAQGVEPLLGRGAGHPPQDVIVFAPGARRRQVHFEHARVRRKPERRDRRCAARPVPADHQPLGFSAHRNTFEGLDQRDKRLEVERRNEDVQLTVMDLHRERPSEVMLLELA